MASVKHHLNHHRTWLPLIIIGAFFIVALVLILLKSYTEQKQNLQENMAQLQQSADLVPAYQSDLRTALNAYNASKDHGAFMQALLTMHVPSDYLSMHVKLVAAADEVNFSQGELDSVVGSVQSEYTWLQ